MIDVGVVGGSGYAGAKIVEILSGHDSVDVRVVTSRMHAGEKVPGLSIDYSQVLVDELNGLDFVFLAVPHGEAKKLLGQLTCKVIDMSSDHRISHVYGLPEVFAQDIGNARVVANPGCYATACLLSVYPIKDMIDHVVFDCISGYSGGGKNTGHDYRNNILAYNLADHLHVSEIEKALSMRVSFTPHVVDTFSGLMCTAHVFLKKDAVVSDVRGLYGEFYSGSFTKAVSGVPCTKDVLGTPFCHVGGFDIDKCGRLVVVSVIDNLMKGAASQAVENMNMMAGLERKEGLGSCF